MARQNLIPVHAVVLRTVFLLAGIMLAMRFEVRQQHEKWIVWDTVNDCAVKGAAGFPGLTAANCMRHPSIAGLLVMKPNSVASLAAEARTFWTQKEAQELADFLNDIEQSWNKERRGLL
jgi:hypothetical protein